MQSGHAALPGGVRLRAIAYSIFALYLMLAAWLAHAASVPVGFADRQVASGLNSPTAMTVLPDERVLVVQQNGAIKLIKDDVLAATDFYTVKNVSSFAERGCLGIVADPDFASNRHIYIYCTLTNGVDSHNRILRVTEANDAVVPGSEQVILDLPPVPPGTQWHMGGALRFGIDGKLYVAVGGHEDTREPPETSNSQNLANPFGKILRINADGSFPSDNPFASTPGAYGGIYNLGLRNPFAFDIQPGTGLMYINDVGAGSWEEINQGIAGANYGWPAFEGPSNDTRYTNAVFAYSHEVGCAITGGAFYNPANPQFPSFYSGKFFYADFCNGTISTIDPANPTAAQTFASDIGNPVNIEVAPDGSLYYLARNQGVGDATAASGTVSKIVFTNTQVPRITLHPQSQTIYVGDPVTFRAGADGATGFQWQRNGVDIAGATAATYTLPSTSLQDNQAVFSVRVINSFGDITSNPAVLTVTTNRLPTATITSPGSNARFTPGDVISYSATASDAEDGNLPPSAYTWRVDFHHDTHSHPFVPETKGVASGTFTVSDFESDVANTWFRLYLTVRDSGGLTRVETRDVFPQGQLGDLTPLGTPVNGSGPIEINRSNGGAAAGDGRTITLDRIPYPKGIGVSAPSELRYELGGACTGHFISDVGVDDEVGDQGSVVFQVWLDGQQVFDSGVMTGKDLRKTVNVSVAGKRELRLVVTDAGDGNAFDHADWGAARVTGCPVSVPAAPNPPTSSEGGAAITPPTGGGGGCSIGGDGRFDPVLPALLLAALGALGWRRRRRG